MAGPNIRNWTAKESSRDIGGGGRNILVEGQVELGSPADTLSLSEQEGPGGSTTMTLDMSIREGTGPDVMTWRQASYGRDLAAAEHFTEVVIRFDGEELETIEVQVIPS